MDRHSNWKIWTFVFLVGLVFTWTVYADNPLPGQREDYIPSPNKCKADFTAWVSDYVKEGPRSIDKLLTPVLGDRSSELMKCKQVDPTQADKYSSLAESYLVESLGRLQDYLGRHNLIEDFLKEDSAGKH